MEMNASQGPSSNVIKYIGAPILFFLILIGLLTGLASAGESVLVVSLDDTITPASDDIIEEAILLAESEEYVALIITLDTPGGGLEETIKIIELIERTEIPVVGYVYPSGATAWSAGTLILIATDISAMAPHTIIGSAQPVQISPTGVEPVNDTKTVNAIVALIEEKARMHKRNETAGREFITANLNLNAETAKEYGIVEFVSSDLQSLLRDIDGYFAKNMTLETKDADLIFFEPDLRLRLLKVMSDPLIAGLLLLIGLYSLIFGISNPGLGAEVFGLMSLSLGLIGLGFSVNLGAIFLILLGLGLILAELHSPGFGLVGLAGLICLAVGSILSVPIGYPEWYLPANYQQTMAISFVIPSLIIGCFFVFAIYKVALVRSASPVIGTIIGDEAVALDQLAPRGYVMYSGEYWLAESDEPIEPGCKVVILEKDGPILKVRRK